MGRKVMAGGSGCSPAAARSVAAGEEARSKARPRPRGARRSRGRANKRIKARKRAEPAARAHRRTLPRVTGSLGIAACAAAVPWGCAAAGAGEMMEAVGGYKDERVPQWGAQETRELIAARGELEREAVASAGRSSKTLWEAVVARLRERGYRRTADQCKCKWKNLVNRYKGKETSDPEHGRQCPFFEELHAVFIERARNIQRQLLQSESGASVKKKLKRPSGDRSSGESNDEEDVIEESDNEKPIRSRKRKAGDKGQQLQRMEAKSSSGSSGIHDLLQDFLVQQQRMDIQRRGMTERRAQERLVFEQEWRQSMQKLEQERLMLEQSCMEREEQRRMREEARAEKRDALLTTLLNKLLQEDL